MEDNLEKSSKRFSFLLTDDEKSNWKEFIDKYEISTISKLLRKSVKFYMENYSTIDFFRNFSKNMHDLKEPLTNIKAICEILLKEKKNELKWENLSYIKDISDQADILQERIINIDQINKEDLNEVDILIVDDDNLTIKILIDFIEDNGYRCKKAMNGKEALEQLNNIRPKLILLDILLPDLMGYEICEIIKSDPKLRDILVYYLTAVPASEVKEQVIKTGAEGYILKPFKFDEIEQLFHLI